MDIKMDMGIKYRGSSKRFQVFKSLYRCHGIALHCMALYWDLF